MKNLHRLCATVLLICVFTIPAAAGDVQTPGFMCPPPIPGELGTPGVTCQGTSDRNAGLGVSRRLGDLLNSDLTFSVVLAIEGVML